MNYLSRLTSPLQAAFQGQALPANGPAKTKASSKASAPNLRLSSKSASVKPLDTTPTPSMSTLKKVGLAALACTAATGIYLWSRNGADPALGQPCLEPINGGELSYCTHPDVYGKLDSACTNSRWLNSGTTPANPWLTPATCPADMQDTYNFHEIFSDRNSHKEFDKFLKNIFPQVDVAKFDTLITDIRRCAKSDEEIYKELVKRIGYTQGGAIQKFSTILRSLKDEAEATSTQVQKVMGHNPKVNGYLEIGYPGRYALPIKEKIGMTGPIVVMNTEQYLTDYVQAGFPLPYNKFVALNDYEAIKESQVPTSSMDLVTCFVGLHHAPKKNLEDFVKSLHRVIRPGGSFILKDHDAHNSTQKAMASVVHSVFNGEGGVSLKEEMEEHRYFQDLGYWVKLLEKHGFKKVSEPLMRDGDPTLNSLVRFERVVTPREQNLSAIKAGLGEGYERAGYQTDLTAIEWHDVEVARQYADCLKTPGCEFPYFRHIQQYQDIFRESHKAAADGMPLESLPSSDYTIMNQFIRAKTALEFGIKGAVSMASSVALKAAAIFSSGSQTAPTDKSAVEMRDAEIAKKYADFIEHTPFYMFPYSDKTKELWDVYKKSGTLKDLPLVVSRAAEFSIKGLASMPISGSYTAPENKEPETIQLIVEGAKNLTAIDDRIQVLKTLPDNEFTLISLPRYRPFTEIWHKLANAGIKAVEIAGQHKIQVKVNVPTVMENPCLDIPGCQKQYDMPILTDPQNKYVSLKVDVPQLGEVIKDLGEKINYIHDF